MSVLRTCALRKEGFDGHAEAQAKPVDGFAGAGELYAMEVDTAAAMQRFQETVREALQQRQNDSGLVGQVLKQLPMQVWA